MLMHYGRIAEHQALFEKLINGASTADRKAAAQEVTEQMLSGGAASFKVCVGSFLSHPVHVQQLLSVRTIACAHSC